MSPTLHCPTCGTPIAPGLETATCADCCTGICDTCAQTQEDADFRARSLCPLCLYGPAPADPIYVPLPGEPRPPRI